VTVIVILFCHNQENMGNDYTSLKIKSKLFIKFQKVPQIPSYVSSSDVSVNPHIYKLESSVDN